MFRWVDLLMLIATLLFHSLYLVLLDSALQCCEKITTFASQSRKGPGERKRPQHRLTPGYECRQGAYLPFDRQTCSITVPTLGSFLLLLLLPMTLTIENFYRQVLRKRGGALLLGVKTHGPIRLLIEIISSQRV